MNAVFVGLAFVVAVNPARLHGALPRREDRRVRVLVVGIGALLALAVYAALAVVAESLLDGLDIDDASMRIAAGLVLLVAGGRDLIALPPAAEPALPGWRAALVPVLIPLLLRPELAVFSISAGADQGVVVTSAAAAFALALVVVSAWLPSDLAPVPTRLRAWLARLTAVALVVVAIDVAIEGVIAV